MDKDFYVTQVEKLGPMLYRVAYTLLHNDADCKDALQDAALKAWEKRSSLRDVSRFSPWMVRILINCCYTIQRRKKRFCPLDSIPEPALPPPDPTLALALSALPEHLRLPLVLHYSEGMDYAEIAAILHLPQSTVRGRIHRAKQALRKELEYE